jgi:hypothetical protein
MPNVQQRNLALRCLRSLFYIVFFATLTFGLVCGLLALF